MAYKTGDEVNAMYQEGNQSGEWRTTLVVIATVFTAICVPLFTRREGVVIWNIDDMTNELSKQVYGQDEVVKNITNAMRESIEMENSRPKLILLLGGPGVGKHHVLNIIRNHVKCGYVNKTVAESCEDNYEHATLIQSERPLSYINIKYLNKYHGITPYFLEFANFEFNIHSPHVNFLKGKYKNRFTWKKSHVIYFMTAPIMSDKTAQKFNNAAEYKSYIKYISEALYDYTRSRFSEYDVITVNFEPMKREDAAKCMQDMDPEVLDDRSDFVPLGCKTR